MGVIRSEVFSKKVENVIIVDPNRVKVQENNGDVSVEDRYVAQEDLVMYAGLKAFTKAKNSIFDDTQTDTTYDFGEIVVNFLNPKQDATTFKNMFTTQWTDTFTDARNRDVTIDPETFGIKSIEITQNASLVPRIVIEFIDVRGKTLMERGNDKDNPYNIFYSMPYPSFVLTIKGYYGKAITYPMVLLKTNTRFDPSSGDYYVRCEFLSRTFAIFNDFVLAYGLAAPYMFPIDGKPGQYEGMEILKWLYQEQNKKIKADMLADKSQLLPNETQEAYTQRIAPEIDRRMITEPVTIYSLLKAGDILTSSDFTNFTDPDVQLQFAARDKFDEIKAGLDGLFEKLGSYFTDDPSNNVMYSDGYYQFKDGKPLTSVPDIMAVINDTNESYTTNILASDNKYVSSLGPTIQTALKKVNVRVSDKEIINVGCVQKSVPGKGIVFTLDDINKIRVAVDDALIEQYKQINLAVLDAQREVIKDKVGFDITVENVIRIFMNCMQTFLMLMNLTSKKAYLQIKNDDQSRKAHQKENSDYYVKDNNQKNPILFPWPNYYVKDQEAQKKGDEIWKRAYPGTKLVNRQWSEVQFIEELYESFTRIKKMDGKVQQPTGKPTYLMTPFLNQVSADQYTTLSKNDTSLEILKKITLALVHDGILFRAPSTEAIQSIADGQVGYDYMALLAKTKEITSGSVYSELQYISNNLLTTKTAGLFENLMVLFSAQIKDVAALKKMVDDECNAYQSGDMNQYKQKTKLFYDSAGNPSYLNDYSSYASRLYMKLISEDNPLDYVNPGNSAGTRTEEFDIASAPTNKQFYTAKFPGYAQVNGKNPFLGDSQTTLNMALGFLNTDPNAATFSFDNAQNSDPNNLVNGVPALTFNNKADVDIDPALQDMQQKYTNY